MSMLAEPRSKQKWSEDPRNTRWSADTSKFGYQMLTRMGWSEGKGLGQNLNGEIAHVKVKKLKSNAGIGMKKSHDDDWISHQDDFNALLNQLNQGSKPSGETKVSSLEQRVKMSKKKILYTKFVKSKDLSNASSRDLAGIFGIRSKSAPASPVLSEDEGNETDNSTASCPVIEQKTEKNHGIVTIHTGLSVADYFAKKMAAMKNKNITDENGSTKETENDFVKETEEKIFDDTETIKKKKKKKRKHIEEEDESTCDSPKIKQSKLSNNDEDSDSLTETPKINKKKKSKKNTDNVENEMEQNNSELSLKKKKKTKTLDTEVESIVQDLPLQKKKKKKRKDVEVEVSSSDKSEEVESDEVVKKKKKKKKQREENENL